MLIEVGTQNNYWKNVTYINTSVCNLYNTTFLNIIQVYYIFLWISTKDVKKQRINMKLGESLTRTPNIAHMKEMIAAVDDHHDDDGT